MLTSSVSLILRGPGVRAQGSATLEDYGHLTIGFASKFAEGVLSHSLAWKCTISRSFPEMSAGEAP
jgi:hypothetical protein